MFFVGAEDPAGGRIVRKRWCLCECLKQVRGGDGDLMVCKVRDCFADGAEVGGALNVAHWQAEMEANEGIRVQRQWGKCKREFWHVDNVEPDMHVRVGKVRFTNEDGTKVRIGLCDTEEDARQGAAELHSLGQSSGHDCIVQAAERVVVDRPVATVVLWDTG